MAECLWVELLSVPSLPRKQSSPVIFRRKASCDSSPSPLNITFHQISNFYKHEFVPFAVSSSVLSPSAGAWVEVEIQCNYNFDL